tara:strand:+ start:141 stop:380 length:240 start_codon:yes stop_codon:yes gene_type:complete
MKNIKLLWTVYYPVILSFLSFIYSVSLWFNGYQLEGIFVGIWVPSILALAICIRQRRNDYYRSLYAEKKLNEFKLNDNE